jgi:hypothetical protein
MEPAIVRMNPQNSRRLRFAFTVQVKYMFDGFDVLLNTEQISNLTARQ